MKDGGERAATRKEKNATLIAESMDDNPTPAVPAETPTEPQIPPVPEQPAQEIPQTETPIPPNPPEEKPPEPIVEVVVPIPNFRFPFNDSYPVTFPFNSPPTTDEMKVKFAQWGISGHHGIDFGLPEGTEVLAVDSGKIIQSGENGDYGNSVIIQHPWGQSLYAHLKETKVSVD